jgi:1-acyl-sn-glycerol-3-phosphate acyltransferase
VSAPTSKPAGPLRAWPRSLIARAARALLRPLVLWVPVRLFCRPLVVVTEQTPPPGPFVLIANHASHFDAPVILASVPRWVRRRTCPAAAADYFYRSRTIGAVTSLTAGAFPFPRTGRLGLARAEELLAAGWSVLLCPEGSRAGGPFRMGVGILAARGATVLPIGVSGTGAVLPKGGWLPRRGPVAVVIGAPVRQRGDPAGLTQMLEAEVRRLACVAGEVAHARSGPS